MEAEDELSDIEDDGEDEAGDRDPEQRFEPMEVCTFVVESEPKHIAEERRHTLGQRRRAELFYCLLST